MATVEAPIESLARAGYLPPRYMADPHRYRRRPTRVVMVGDVGVGGHNPIRVQSMTTTDTMDTDATVAQTVRLVDAGCEIVRITAPTVEDARNIGVIRRVLRARGIRVPLVADIHFNPAAALEAADHVEKVRINPGNFADSKRFAIREYSDAQYVAELGRIEERFAPLVKKCKAGGIAMRIGTNHGSLSDRIMNRFGDTPLGMVESALEFVHICGRYDYHDVIFSMKASNPKVMIQAYRLLAARLDELGLDYPFHLGVTEAGNGEDGRIKSAIGIGSLLEDGIGDTIRVSLTEDPEYEVPVAFALARPYQPDRAPTHQAPTHRAPTDPAPPLHAPRASATPTSATPTSAFAPAAAAGVYGYDPYAYTRRASRPIALGTMAIGGGQPVRVVQALPGDLATVDRAVERARALAGADGLVRARPDALAVTVRTVADVEALRALRIALDASDGPADALDTPVAATAATAATETAATAPLSLVVCVSPGVPRLADLARDADAICLAVPWEVGDSAAEGTLRGALETIAASRRPLLLEAAPAGAAAATSPPAAAETAVTRLLDAATTAEAAGCRDLALSVRARQTGLALRTYRRLAARAAGAGKDYPIQLVAWPEGEAGAVLLRAAVLLGALLCDGIGDAVQIVGFEGSGPPGDGARARLAFNILQGAGVRLSKTEFVACPSCGRTLFDLQETTERIQHKTGHLKGVKIAIMGCIVNGPGEMADADFGYVGGAPGKVNLYVGKECIEKGVPAGGADDRLIELIRRHGKWVDPPSST